MTESKDDSSDIAQRIEKLNQWQEEQKKILFARQNNQRKLLGLEHKKMCELLGIYHAEPNLLGDGDIADEICRNDTTLGVDILDDTVHDGKEVQQQRVKPKRSFLRRKQGLKKRFNMDPDQFRLDKLPPYSFASRHPSLKRKTTKNRPVTVKGVEANKDPIPTVSKSILKLKQNEKPNNSINGIDLLEEKFQKSLISSKTACNSTPDMKSHSSNVQETPESSPIPASWAKILDPQNIKPIEHFLSSSQESREETDNLSIFELLEQKAKDGSFDLNSSSMKIFLRKSQDDLKGDAFKASFSVKLPPIPYDVYRSSKSIVSGSTDTECEEDEIIRSPAHVHFADMPPSNARSQNASEALDSSDASHLFDEFKKLLFANQNDTTLTDGGSDVAQEILQKADLIKERLRELEMEISKFKENNLELVKSKQEHELEKAHFEQERKELLAKLNDEKIQMEIYLHDERMKLVVDRKKMENQIRSQKALVAAKEKKEVTKLHEEIESLQKDLKKKEEIHIVSQSRLKAQIRNLEKDVRQLNLDMEILNKENKRLEAESLKISRQNNNKMLQEINRNIAKLTSKEPPVNPIKKSPAEKIPHISKEQTKAKVITKSKSVEAKRKTIPIKRQKSPVQSSDDDVSTSSSAELEYSPQKVTVADQSISAEKAPPCENPTIPVDDTTFKREILNPDGSKDIWYPNGNLKKISADGMIIRMLYFNKDIKETNIHEGTVKYYYSDSNTWHTTYLDGLEILEFPNGQTEHRYKNGKIEVHFPNNSIKITDPTDNHKLAEWRFADGTNLMQMKNGDKILLLPNGQKEIHTTLSKRREYPDGTVKLVYPDGSQETRYSNGRVRLKDKDGKLVMDTENVKY